MGHPKINPHIIKSPKIRDFYFRFFLFLQLSHKTGDSFRLTIIPHTMKETLFSTYKKGTRVNVETDMFARYIEHILNAKQKLNTLSWNEIDKINSLY